MAKEGKDYGLDTRFKFIDSSDATVTSMRERMQMIVSRGSLLDDLLALLASLGVDASTQLPNVHGVGEAGAALDPFEAPASNAVILAALERDTARDVIGELEKFRDRSAAL